MAIAQQTIQDRRDKYITDQVEEYFKCKNDIIYYIENYIQLSLPGGNQLMKLYQPQKRVINSFMTNHHVISLKSRQIGISTLTQVYIAYIVTFYKNVVIGMVSRDGNESTDFCRKTMSLINNLPDFLRPRFIKETEQTFILDNGCQFFASQVNESKPGGLFRSKAITLAIIDEAAHIGRIDEAYTGMAPALFKSQKVARENGVPFGTIIISTPNKTVGLGKWYYDKWVTAQEPGTLFTAEKVHWKDVKEFRDDPMWYKTQCEILENVQWKIDQELEMKFVASEGSFFPPDTISELNECEKEPIAKYLVENKYEILQFAPRIMDKFYLIGIDTASASGDDNSTIQVIDYETFDQVMEFRDKLRVDEFCKVVATVAKIYPNNLMIPENNTYGNQVMEYLTKSGASYRLYQQKVVNTQKKNAKTRFRYGLYTGSQTRPLIIDALYTYIVENPSLVKSRRTILELIGLIKSKSGKVEADAGANDDLALALAMCAYVKMYDPPIGMGSNVISNDNEIETIVETIALNLDSSLYVPTRYSSTRLNGTPMDRVSINAKLNKSIMNHVSNNLATMGQLNSSGNTVIDISKILGHYK